MNLSLYVYWLCFSEEPRLMQTSDWTQKKETWRVLENEGGQDLGTSSRPKTVIRMKVGKIWKN